jgi:hypothetical protein
MNKTTNRNEKKILVADLQARCRKGLCERRRRKRTDEIRVIVIRLRSLIINI